MLSVSGMMVLNAELKSMKRMREYVLGLSACLRRKCMRRDTASSTDLPDQKKFVHTDQGFVPSRSVGKLEGV